MTYKIGIGYDIHRLVEERKLLLGGVEIPCIKGLFGHSDADVLLHAITDALLGAAGLGDIGEQFPDTDPQYHGASSASLLKTVLGLVREKGFLIVNVDTVIIAEKPVLSPFKKHIQESVAQTLDIKSDCVSIKAKTNEGLGELGENKAIATYAVVLLSKGE
ncbi:MAG: 2-C-methyl-D-erythritol 2,4-cyclodiphosphate synthase [Candidatus Omnitrophica bacterium]|nr:2-C-methyl-D-erythritol 2,4-cyclodiphosphate synthase [Candidatus Omnitrophota bacterium]